MGRTWTRDVGGGGERVMEMTLEQIRREITLALAAVHQSLESLQRVQHQQSEQLGQHGRLLERLDERSRITPAASRAEGEPRGRLNGNAKPAGVGAALVGVIWMLVEVIKTMAAATP